MTTIQSNQGIINLPFLGYVIHLTPRASYSLSQDQFALSVSLDGTDITSHLEFVTKGLRQNKPATTIDLIQVMEELRRRAMVLMGPITIPDFAEYIVGKATESAVLPDGEEWPSDKDCAVRYRVKAWPTSWDPIRTVFFDTPEEMEEWHLRMQQWASLDGNEYEATYYRWDWVELHPDYTSNLLQPTSA